jgi:hypothetical protein
MKIQRFIHVLFLLILFGFIFFLILNYKLNFKKSNSLQDFVLNYNKIERLLCMVLTTETNIQTRGLAVYKTWGKDIENNGGKIIFSCNCPNIMKYKKLIEENKEIPKELQIYKHVAHLPLVHINVTEDKRQMGQKIVVVLKESYEIYKNSSNWYFLVDDDAYLFVDNLYKFMNFENTFEAFMYGFHFKHLPLPNGHIGGGPGILLTQESMMRLVNKIYENGCKQFIDTFGDVTVGACGYSAGILIGKSEDEYGRPRFHFHDVDTHFKGPIPKYLYEYGVHNKKIGKECCSLETISFHYISESNMYAMHKNKNFLKDLLT